MMTTNHISVTTADKNRQNWCTPNRYVMATTGQSILASEAEVSDALSMAALLAVDGHWTV